MSSPFILCSGKIHFQDALQLYITIERHGSLMVSTTTCHPGGRRFALRTRRMTLLGVKTWLSTLETVYLRLSDDTLKTVGPFYLVSMPEEVKDPTQGVNM